MRQAAIGLAGIALLVGVALGWLLHEATDWPAPCSYGHSHAEETAPWAGDMGSTGCLSERGRDLWLWGDGMTWTAAQPTPHNHQHPEAH